MSSITVDQIDTTGGDKLIISNGINFDTPIRLKNYVEGDIASITGMQSGDIIFDSTNDKVKVFTGSAWEEIGSLDGIRQTSYDVINEATTNAGVTLENVLHKDGEVSVDTINEFTNGVGVTIDGIVLLDNTISAVDSIAVDVVNEKTTGSGVTVDGLLIRDKKLGDGLQLTGYREQKNTVSSSSNILSLDVTEYNTFQCALSENINEIHISNLGTGVHNIQIFFTQHSSNSYTIANTFSYNAGNNTFSAKTAGNAGFTMTATNGSVDVMTLSIIDVGIPFLTVLQDLRNT
jgi:hypothetical protein